MAALLPTLLCLASGFLLVSLGWPHRKPAFSDYLYRTSLSIGFGLGIFSVIFFLALLLGITHLLLVDCVVLALLLTAFFGMRNRTEEAGSATQAKQIPDPIGEQRTWHGRLVTGGFVIALCSALYAAVMRVLAYPHGDGWDAFSIWNLHARFLFLGGAHWRDGFTALLPWSHPDYPLLLPGAVVHFWSYLGHDNPAVPAVIGLLFTFATVALLLASLLELRGRTPAMLAATALLATPSFIEQGTAQYADVPLSFFILASITVLCLHDDLVLNEGSHAARYSGLLVLAGLAAGFAAWTKNEGLLFLGALVVARLMALRHRNVPRSQIGRARKIAPLVVATIPALILIAYFKHFIAPPGDLFSSDASSLHKLLQPARYWAIVQWYVKGFFRFGRWLLLPGTILLIGYYLVVGKEEYAEPRPGIRTSSLALALTLAGYFAVYLVTPYDIYWHLRFSLMRLFLQLWPSAIFLFFLVVRSSETNISPAELKRDAPDHA